MKATAVLAVAVAVLAEEAAPAAPAAAAVSVAAPLTAPAPFIGARTGGFGAVRSQPYTGYRGFARPQYQPYGFGAVRSQPYTGYRGFGGFAGGYYPRTAPVRMAAAPAPKKEKAEVTPEMSEALAAAHADIDGQAHDLTVATIDLMAELDTNTADFGNFAILGDLKSAQGDLVASREELAKAKAHPEKYDVVQAQLAADTANAAYLENYFLYQEAEGKNFGKVGPLVVLQDMNSATAAKLTLDANPNDADAQFGHRMAQNDLMSTIADFKGEDRMAQIFGVASTSMDLPGARADAAAAQQAFAMTPNRLNQIDMEMADLALAAVEADVNSQIVSKSKLAALLAFTVESNAQKINKLALERATLVMNRGGNELLYSGMRTGGFF